MDLTTYFDHVNYNNQNLNNILRKVVPIKNILNRVDVYFDYHIKEGERADTIAYDYYGDSDYTWLIYIVNDIFDPYYGWPLTDKQMIKYLNTKYGDYNQTKVTVKHYINPDEDYVMSPYTFSQLPPVDKVGWVAEYVYDWEVKLNEAKRDIKLVSNRYLDQINQQVSELFE